jgi:hypothetical protein
VNAVTKAVIQKSAALKKTATAVMTMHNMGVFSKLAKLKAYWMLLTGFVTLVLIPVIKLLTKKDKKTVDAKFDEVKK